MKKIFLLIFAISILISSCKKSAGKLSGVVTYYFNDNFGYRPDVGATVLIINTKSIDLSRIDTLMIFKRLYFARNADPKFMSPNSSAEAEADKFLMDDKQFDLFTKKCYAIILNIRNNKNIKIVAVDGNGSFSVALPSGKYWVITQSSHRTELNMLEIEGQIKIEEVQVESENESTVNTKFDEGIKESPF